MTCKICGGITTSLGTVPFDTNNSGVPVVKIHPIEYVKCTKCYSISSPEMLSWTPDQLAHFVYNQDYIKYDPDYTGFRAEDYGQFLQKLLPKGVQKHLDYGSGCGGLSEILNWHSENYDPYSSTKRPVGHFNLITAIEVFEHSTDLDRTIKDIMQYLDRRGAIFFSTSLADKNTKIDWSYIAPRNGHINIQSKESMKILARNNGLFFDSIKENIHVLQRTRNDFKDLQRGTKW